MTPPRGGEGTTNPFSHSRSQSSPDSDENTHFLSRTAGLSQSYAPLPYLTATSQQFVPRRLGGYVFERTTFRPSANSSIIDTPLPSRSPSLLPRLYSPGFSSSSDTESDEPVSPLLLDTYTTYLREGKPRWWQLPQRSRWELRRTSLLRYKYILRVFRRVFRHPFFPKHPSAIVLSLLFFSILALSITLLLIHLLNPDKEPLPWRAYCTVPETSSVPPPLNARPTFLNVSTVESASPMPPFPPSNFDSLPPAGIFVGVFSMDWSSERRMLIRSTWASHVRSRNGAGDGDGGAGTSRTIVRFIMGQPRRTWDRRVRLEMEEFNDIIILPISENMNAGKSYAFFTWAASKAWVPPLYFDTEIPLPTFSYSNESAPAPSLLAQHDPVLSWWHRRSDAQEWVRPDFLVKVDDDSFVMLAELEARLRVTLHEQRTEKVDDQPRVDRPVVSTRPDAESSPSTPSWTSPSSHHQPRPLSPAGATSIDDPLIYWGYLVKRRFMAGELYALSWSLVDWISKDPAVKGHVRGAEDKQTAKWMRLHPRAEEVRWVAERCWIYDHPRSGTVYSHGFLFPSEATRVRDGVRAFFNKEPVPAVPQVVTTQSRYDRDWAAPPEWTRSSVSTFGVRYSPPLPNLATLESIEALVEGSEMSGLSEESVWSAGEAWQLREGRRKRYNDQRLGGTVVVHFIKKQMWFFETALALLDGEEETEYELQRRIREERQRGGAAALTWTTNLHRAHMNGGQLAFYAPTA